MRKAEEIRILVFDDDIDVGESISCLLDLEGFNITNADGADKAMGILKDGNIDFVLSDVKMPSIDGMQLLKDIKAIYPVIPIVMLMSGFSDYTEENALAHGAIGLIDKPLDTDKLVAQIFASVV